MPDFHFTHAVWSKVGLARRQSCVQTLAKQIKPDENATEAVIYGE